MRIYPNGNRFRWASRLLMAYALVSLLDLPLNGQGMYLTSHIMAVHELTVASFERVLSLVAFVQGLLLLACGIAFLLWWHRSVVNIKNLTADISGDPQWGVVSWFVPIANLFVPYRFTAEMADDGLRKAPNLPIWWGAWIVGSALSRLGTNRYEKAVTPDEYREAFLIFCGADVLLIVAALTLLRIMKFIQDRQLRLSVAQRHAAPAAPVS